MLNTRRTWISGLLAMPLSSAVSPAWADDSGNGPYFNGAMVRAQPLGQMAGYLNPSIQPQAELGLVKDSLSLGGMVSFSTWNGCHYDSQIRGECSGASGTQGPLIQGDTLMLSVGAVTRYQLMDGRFQSHGIGGAGVAMLPLLMDEDYYESEVVAETWGGIDPDWHDKIYPTVTAGMSFGYPLFEHGPTIELSATSTYMLGFDAFVNVGLGLHTQFGPASVGIASATQLEGGGSASGGGGKKGKSKDGGGSGDARIQLTGIEAFDAVFSEAQSIDERIARMTGELQAAQGAITQLSGGNGELNLEAIKASLPGTLMSSIQINLNIGQGLPEITLAPQAPPDLVPWVDAIRQLATSAAQIAIDAPGMVKDVMALVDAAKAFPGEAPASIQAAVASGAVKPLEAAKLPKKIVGNVEAMAQIPTDLAELGKEAMATMELVQALVQ